MARQLPISYKTFRESAVASQVKGRTVIKKVLCRCHIVGGERGAARYRAKDL